MRGRWCFVVAGLSLAVPGCDPQLDDSSIKCATSADCPYTTACDPRSRKCVLEPQGYAFGTFSCRVFESVSPNGAPSTTDVVGVIDGARLTLQGGASCFPGSITIVSAGTPGGTTYKLIVLLPKGFAGGPLSLGPTNAYVEAVGGGRAEAQPVHGVASGDLNVSAGYGAGAAVTGSVVFTPTRACGETTGGFCPSGQRCSAIFTTNTKDGVCNPLPEQPACSSNLDCPLGTNCVFGACLKPCTGTTASECNASELCAAVDSAAFLAKRLGACAPAGSVAKWHAPCPAGTHCLFNSICADFGKGPVCSDYCQSSLACEKGFGCTPLSNGADVCAAGVSTAGQSCASGLCDISSVCISTDSLCHEYCSSDGDCPPARPSCISLKSGNQACAAPLPSCSASS
jgi:hypothetical protein